MSEVQGPAARRGACVASAHARRAASWARRREDEQTGPRRGDRATGRRRGENKAPHSCSRDRSLGNSGRVLGAGRGGAGRGRDEGGQGAGPRWSSQPPASVRANPAPLIRRGCSTNCIAGTAHASAPGLCAEPQGRENQSHFQQSDVAGSPERDGTVPDSAVTPLTCFGACAPTPLRRPAHGQAAQSWGGDRCPVAAGNCARASCRLTGKGPDAGTGHPASLRSLADHPRGPRAAAPAACHPPPPWALPPMVPCHLEPADLPPGCLPTECGLVETFKIIDLLPS